MDTHVTSQVLKAMEAAADRAYPKEACGILLGEDTLVSEFVVTANVHPAPETHFEIDPQALLNAHRDAREGGPQVLGYFHSHPRGPAKPSKTDQTMAAKDEKVWAISGDGGIRLWRDAKAGFELLSYRIVEG